MDWSKGEYDPWIAARMFEKFDVHTRWPSEAELPDWLEGWKHSCAEMAEFEQWKQRLKEYAEQHYAPEYIWKLV